MQECNETNFADTQKGVSLLLFEALWCPHCHAMHPVLTEAERDYPALRCYRVNIENNPTLSARFSIRSVPTLILFRDGRELGRAFGFLRTLEQFLTEAGVERSKAHV